jgi:hypothetical protein
MIVTEDVFISCSVFSELNRTLKEAFTQHCKKRKVKERGWRHHNPGKL